MKIKQAFQIVVVIVAIFWAVFLIDWIFNLQLSRFGILPRQISHLSGILFAPFLHGNLWHLISNTVPFIILGTGVIYFYGKRWVLIYFAIYLLTGIFVWIVGRTSLHIGASGVIYGFASFLFFAGLFRRNIQSLLVSIAIVLLYGGMIFGILPGQLGVSWESHLAGALVGAGMAYGLRKDSDSKKTNN